ncbi:iron ABC transporter [Cutibacterium acnes JCM 18909]|nr:iron ABC transporter [Cutibacterium acnes JCM 18909]
MGRAPHKRSWQSLGAGDIELCYATMKVMEVDNLAGSSFFEDFWG